MESAVGVFVNGISGVFIGMAVLYLAMKLIAFICAKWAAPEKIE